MATRWTFPFKTTNGKPLTDRFEALNLLAGSNSGFFPFGTNDLWHGGVHIPKATTPADTTKGLLAISDGQVLAYRIDRTYPETTYTKDRKASFSTGFVLISHKLQLPKDAAKKDDKPKEVTIYSVYVHLADLKTYDDDLKLSRPTYWEPSKTKFVVAENAKDKNNLAKNIVGANIRDSESKIVGLLARGSVVELGDPHPSKAGFFAVTSVTKEATGSVVPSTKPYYIFRPEQTPKLEPHYEALDAIHLLATPVAIKAGELVGYLGTYDDFDNATTTGTARGLQQLVHVETFAGPDWPAFLADSKAYGSALDVKKKDCLVADKKTLLCKPAAADTKVAADLLVSATADDPKAGPWVKVQPFRMVSVPKKKPTRTNVGAAVWIGRSQLSANNQEREAWTQCPLSTSITNNESRNASVHPRIFTRRELDTRPAAEKFEDDNKAQWWKVKLGNATGTDEGWICGSGHTNVSWKSRWEWPGFEMLEEASTPADQAARGIQQRGGATEQEQANFKARANKVDGGALMTELRDAIDWTGTHDGLISTAELRNALQTPWLADRISRLIVKYESEWGGSTAKWDALDSLMKDGLDDWKAEKGRIAKLAWWDSVKSAKAFPSSPEVHHFHPIGLAANLMSKPVITATMLKAIFKGGDDSRIQAAVEDINEHIEEYKLDTALRLSHFFAQVREEAGANFRFTENLDYSPAGLIGTFSYFSNHPKEAETYGRTDDHAANQEAIANRAYANKIGNGDVASGDGWRFRGRGLKQLTGRDNYKSFTTNYRRVWSDGAEDFEANPDLVSEGMYAVRSAVYFWLHHDLYEIADKGASDGNVNSITAIINLHTKSYENRRTHFWSIWNGKVFDTIG
jgi:predicted chitinase